MFKNYKIIEFFSSLSFLVPLVPLWLIGFVFFFPFRVLAEEWVFLPPAPLFRPLIGDPREPQTSVISHTSQVRFEGALGATVELARFSPPDGTQWSVGMFGTGFILLDQEGVAFPMRNNDWLAGMYLTGSSGSFSHRLEFLHQSSHLGDSLEGLQEPIIYNGENFNYTFSYQPSESLRFYAGLGVWENIYPYDNAFFASLGAEVFSTASEFIGTTVRGYGTFHLKWKAQGAGTLNKTAQLGIQWKFNPEESRALRLAVIFYDGNYEYGQFYQGHDNHWAVGVYFDP